MEQLIMIIILSAFLVQSVIIAVLLHNNKKAENKAERDGSDKEETKITESILNGIENNEFKMYLQFVVDNKIKNNGDIYFLNVKVSFLFSGTKKERNF